MGTKLTVAKFTTLPSSSGWVQIHDFTPDGEEKRQARGRLLLVIATQGESTGPLPNVIGGREILTRIHEEYFGSLEDSTFEALSRSIAKVSQEFSEETRDLEIGALAFVGESVYFASFGEISAYVLRGGVISKILSANERIFSGSGFLAVGDMFVLGSKGFFEGQTQGEIKAALLTGNVEAAMENLSPIAHQVTAPRAGGVVIRVEETVSQEPEEIVQVSPQSHREESSTITFEKGGLLVKTRYFLADTLGKVITRLPERKIRVAADLQALEEEKSKKTAASVGVLLLLILLLSVVFGIRQQMTKKEKAKYEPRLVAALHDLEEAKSLSGLNQTRSRELLFSARKTGEELTAEGIKDKRLEELLSGVAANLGQIAGVYEVTLDNYLDLSLMSSGFNGDQLSFSDGRLLVLDRAGRLISVETATKKTKTVAGADKLKRALLAAPYAEKNYVLGEEGVVEIPSTNLVLTKDWQDAAGFTVYAGNIYVLDRAEGAIWRYTGTGEIFGSQKNWFGAGVEPDLSLVRSWAIDGSIWVLSGEGKISRFTLGSPREFVVSGLDGNLMGATSLYTDENSEYLYILDPAMGRVVILDKDGEFKAEYVSDQIKDTTQMVVAEVDKKIILLSGAKLLGIEIKHF